MVSSRAKTPSGAAEAIPMPTEMDSRVVDIERRDGAMVGRAAETASHRERGRKEAAPVSTASLDGANLLALEYLLDFVELVERLDGRKVVDVEPQYLVADLREHRVVELEEAELHTACAGAAFGNLLA